MKFFIVVFWIFACWISASCWAQIDWYAQELRNLYDLSQLPAYSNDTVYQLSSYDRTGGYRLLLSDKINFNSSYQLTIEHGPENNEIAVDYSSVGFFYADHPQFENQSRAEVKNKIRRRDILTAQDFLLKLYWFTSADLGENSVLLSSRKSDRWMSNIDFEAVPMAQIDLTGLDNGRYKVRVVYSGKKDGAPFSVWQRTQPVSGWLETNLPKEKIEAEAGEIRISDQIKTLTLRKKKTDDTTIEIQAFIFERINE